MDLEVVGRHALFFDDDAMAAFVNSTDALVEWNSLIIDRYDVRHLLSSPPLQTRRSLSSLSHAIDSSLKSELDLERYLDLPISVNHQEKEEDGVHLDNNTGRYNAIPFSYGNVNGEAEEVSHDMGIHSSGFRPPFNVPEHLLQCLPPSEKVHQIIARTALFVSSHGGQSEIVLRVKQGDNPTFGFLMPDHHLHPYYRFLVDHQELLHSNGDMKPQTGERKVVNEPDGALSLLGSVYGSGEDEDVSNKTTSDEAVDAVPNAQKEQFSALLPKQDESVLKHPFHSGGLDNEKTHILKKNPLVGGFNGGSTSHKKPKDDHVSVSVHAALEKLKESGLGITLKTEPVALEPPSDLKKLIGKIVEFIRKNGKQFEATLIEQDNKHCRFPFLLPSNMYHPYYLKVLHGSQETKYSGNSLQSGSDGSLGKRPEERASLSLVSGDGDLPYENDKKEKFKMVIGKSKKESQEQLDKAPQQENGGFSVDAASAAAILQAAARGIKNPNIAIFSKTAENAETSAEADSCDPQLSKEQQLKAERLKKAKMFVAMLKNRSVPSLKGEPSRAVSSEPHYSGQLDGNRSDQGEGLKFIDEYSAKRSMRKYRSNASRHEEDEEDEGETEHQSLGSDHKSLRHMPDDDKGEKSEDRKEHRRSKRKKHHQSHHSDEDSDVSDRYEEERRSRRHSRKNHRSHNKRDDDDDEIDEEKHHRHSRKKHKSHNSSKNTSRHERSKRASHCDDEHHRNKSDKLRKGAADGEDLEEGEISKVSDQSTRGPVCREASNDVSSPARSTSQPSDELRAKIRAMLMEARR